MLVLKTLPRVKLQMSDTLGFELLVNKTMLKKRDKDDVNAPLLRRFRKMCEGLESVILNDPFILSNFEMFMNKVESSVHQTVATFRHNGSKSNKAD